MTVSTEELELNTLIERLHNPYYTTKDIVDAVLYLLHRERNQQLAMQRIWDSDAKAMEAMHNEEEENKIIKGPYIINQNQSVKTTTYEDVPIDPEPNSINQMNEKIEDAEYRNNKEQQEV